MNIEWINEKYKEANRIFDSSFEVYEWADSLYSDFGGGLYTYVGYASPDKNVFDYLIENLPKWIELNKANNIVNTSIEQIEGKVIYKIWISRYPDWQHPIV